MPTLFKKFKLECLFVISMDIPRPKVAKESTRSTNVEIQQEQVLERLEKANFRENLRNCYFGESKIDYLGYEITRDGIQPQPKKVEAILNLSPPKTIKTFLRHD
jgi:hypothetical protein